MGMPPPGDPPLCLWGAMGSPAAPPTPTCGQALGGRKVEDGVIADGPLRGLQGDGFQPPQLGQLGVDLGS